MEKNLKIKSIDLRPKDKCVACSKLPFGKNLFLPLLKFKQWIPYSVI